MWGLWTPSAGILAQHPMQAGLRSPICNTTNPVTSLRPPDIWKHTSVFLIIYVSTLSVHWLTKINVHLLTGNYKILAAFYPICPRQPQTGMSLLFLPWVPEVPDHPENRKKKKKDSEWFPFYSLFLCCSVHQFARQDTDIYHSWEPVPLGTRPND